jgi:hypothetical protein
LFQRFPLHRSAGRSLSFGKTKSLPGKVRRVFVIALRQADAKTEKHAVRNYGADPYDFRVATAAAGLCQVKQFDAGLKAAETY